MRIVYLHQYFVTPEMSGGTRSYEFARRLVADGHEVHMITSDTSGGKKRQEVIEGINVTWIPVEYSNQMSFLRRIWAFVVFAVLASVAGVRSRPTLVFATSTPLTIVIPALVTKWVRRVPMVFEVRDLWPEMPIAVGALRNPILIKIARWMEKLAYFQSRAVIALSPGMKEGVVTTGYPEEQVVVIPNSSDVERFQIDPQLGKAWLASQSWHRGGPVVLYAGTLGLINGVDYMVDVAAAAREIAPDIDFLIVGNGKMKESIREKADACGVLGRNLHMLDPLPKQDMPLPYAAATVALSLFKPIKEMESNSANKFFDALASGTPVAINYGGWQEKLLEEFGCGIRLPLSPVIAAGELGDFIRILQGGGSHGRSALHLAESEFRLDKLYSTFQDIIAGEY